MHRAKRAKAVAPMFAQGRVREACAEGVVSEVVDDFVEVLRRKGGQVVDLLDLSRRVANDALSGYLFGEKYGAFEELSTSQEKKVNGEGLSAGAFVDGFVEVGKFYLLPPRVFRLLISFLQYWYPDSRFEASEKQINEYVEKVVSRSNTDVTITYQSKLLDVGISSSETIAQCKDLIFAGTDSTSTNLATILWNLCRSPETLQKLYNELSGADDKSQSSLLHATIREGLRVGMANPARLPRVVPKGGWQWGNYQISEGTSVGCSSYSLHFDPELFPEPFDFIPERWMGTAGESKADGKNCLDDMKTAWFAFGAGTRQCIARTFATEELTVAVEKVVLSRVLEGARAVGEKIEYLDWFNSQILEGKIEVELKPVES